MLEWKMTMPVKVKKAATAAITLKMAMMATQMLRAMATQLLELMMMTHTFLTLQAKAKTIAAVKRSVGI